MGRAAVDHTDQPVTRPRSPMPEERAAPTAPAVEIVALEKEFRRQDGARVRAIDSVDLRVDRGEFVVLLGPSGCGKTTLLRAIAGLEQPDSGRIDIGSETRFSSERGIAQPPEKRGISMIFQSYALWPHMSVFKNVAYPLQSRRRRLSRQAIRERVDAALTQVGIPELSAQYPSQLSGGQQQRVALARALVSQDELILFDEPLSNVDAKVREHLRVELAAMQRSLGFTAIFVTHDQTEAMELASRIAVVDRGRVAQIGTPHEIYHRPTSRYVAKFIGAINEIEGRVAAVDAGVVVVETDHGRVVSSQPAPGIAVGDEVVALWRPERGHADVVEPDRPNRWPAVVEAAMFVGSHTEFALRSGDMAARLWSPRMESISSGEQVWVSVDVQDVQVLPREDSTGVQTAEG